MIKVNIMSLGLGVHGTMRSGYFHFGNHTYGLNTKIANFMDLTVIRYASDGTVLRHRCGIYVFRLISVQ